MWGKAMSARALSDVMPRGVRLSFSLLELGDFFQSGE